MIVTDKRKAVFLLHQEGMAVREIARRLALSRNTVRAIIRQEGTTPQPVRTTKQRLDEELLRRLYQECQGRMVRVYEKLVEEEGVAVTYSTLTRRLRELGISQPQKQRCHRVPDEPGSSCGPCAVTTGDHATGHRPSKFAGESIRPLAGPSNG